MIELELEKTYLAKYLPEDIISHSSELISDIYVPEGAPHPILRLRHKGNAYCVTKKEPIANDDSTRQNEHTINLSQEEYEALAACSHKSFTKRRYAMEFDGHPAEVDIYLGDLAGLVVIDFEFATDEAMNAFTPPDICLADVSQDPLIAAGKLAGKAYEDIRSQLEAYNYHPLTLKETR